MSGKMDTLAAMMQRQMEQPAQGGARTIEAITQEILTCKVRAGEAILQIGRCLIEAKELLPHGEWLPWLNERVEFTERQAQRFMRLAKEWSNPTALSDLGATKALALLALPTEERERFMAEPHEVDGQEKTVIDMSARQLEQAIREREEALVREKAAEEARAKMEADMKLAKELLASAQSERDAAAIREAALQRELEELRARPVEVAVETVVDQTAIDKARAEAVSGMQAKLREAKDARKQAEEREREAQAALEEANRRLAEQAKAQHVADLTADKDVAQFELLYTQAQEQASKLRGLLLQVRGRDQETGDKLAKAILALAEAIRGCAE